MDGFATSGNPIHNTDRNPPLTLPTCVLMIDRFDKYSAFDVDDETEILNENSKLGADDEVEIAFNPEKVDSEVKDPREVVTVCLTGENVPLEI